MKDDRLIKILILLLFVGIAMLTCSCQFDFVDDDEENCRIQNEWIDGQIRIEEAKCDGMDKCRIDYKKIQRLNEQRCEF